MQALAREHSYDDSRPPGLDAGIDHWVGRHQAAVWRYLRFLGCPRQLAEDFVQDAFLAALERGVPHLQEGASRAWLRTAVRNLWRMELRRAGRRPELEAQASLDEVWSAVVGTADGGAYLDALVLCLGGLGAQGRRAVELRYGQGASRSEMAVALDLSEAGVKALLRRVRAALRTCVEHKIESEEAT